MTPSKISDPYQSTREGQKAQTKFNFESFRKSLTINKMQVKIEKTAKEIQSVIEKLWLS